MMHIAFRLAAISMATLLLSVPASAQPPQDEVVYYHLDAVGSVRATTNSAGQTLERFDFLPFGEPWPGAGNERIQFTGAERDPSTGFTYLMARYLFVNAGRFTSPDSAGYSHPSNPQTWNLYVYVANQPLTFIDPSGHDCVSTSTNTSTTVTCTTTWEQIMQNLIAVSQRRPPLVPIVSLAGIGSPPGPTVPLDPTSVPSCLKLTEVGNFGAIKISQPSSGNLVWDVDLKPIVGILRVMEEFRYAGRSRQTSTSRPYFYVGRGGTTHGSRLGLEVGSRYRLLAVATAPPSLGVGYAECVVY